MRKRIDPDAPFQSVKGASYRTGFSMAHIRSGCKDGTIPHIKVGTDYRINVPLWLELLDKQSAASVKGSDNCV